MLDYAPLTALIGQRLSWVIAPPAEARPYVVAQVIRDDPAAQSADGPGRVHWLGVQFDCVAETQESAQAVHAEVLNAIGTVRGYTTTAFRFDGALVDERGRDDYDPPQDASEIGLHRRIVEVRFVVTLIAPGPVGP